MSHGTVDGRPGALCAALLLWWWLPSVCAAVSPRTGPADPAEPVCATTSRRAGPEADEELARLRKLLDAWTSHPDWPHLAPAEGTNPLSAVVAGDPCPEISGCLALFESRFGARWEDCSAAAELRDVAARTNDRLRVEYPEPRPGTSAVGDPWISPGWVGARALLAELAGCGDAARSILFGDTERSWDGCCVWDLSEDLYYVATSRAGFLDRAGDRAAALRWYHEAYYRCFQDGAADVFGRSRRASDLVLARYAQLLLAAGEPEAAAGIRDVLLARRPATPGAAALLDSLSEGERDAPASGCMVFSLEIFVDAEGTGSGRAYVIGDPADATRWKLVAVSLPRWPERETGSRMRPECHADLEVVEATDPRVLPMIRTCVSQTNPWHWTQGLLALQALNRSGQAELRACLQSSVEDEYDGWRTVAQGTDHAARLVCGDGPLLDRPVQQLTYAELRDAWLKWLP